jgi:serine/threonine-protein kinase RsbW
VDEAALLHHDLTRVMQEAGYNERDIFCLRLALAEGVSNAIKHGHAGDGSKPVRVGYAVGAAEVLVQIEDQGGGFDPDAVPDPLASENRERCGGRGVHLIREYTTWVRYNERGNCVTFCRRRSG